MISSSQVPGRASLGNALAVVGIMGALFGSVRAQPVLDVVPNGAGGATLSVTNIPPGTTSGATFVSLDTSMPVGQGAVFGLNMSYVDYLAWIVALPPANAGDPVHWTYPSPGAFPEVPFQFPPGSIQIPEFDVLAMAITPAGSSYSNVVRYAAPAPLNLSTTTLAENAVFEVSVPLIENPLATGDDFCSLIKGPNGDFERVRMDRLPSGAFEARVEEGAVLPSGNLVVAEGVGDRTLPALAPNGALIVETLAWTRMGAINPQQSGNVTLNGTGVANGSSCAGPCVIYKGTVDCPPPPPPPAAPRPCTEATWSARIPFDVMQCLCDPNTEIVLDIHGNIRNPATGVSRIHFDTWTHGMSPASPLPCTCLRAVIDAYRVTVEAQTSNNMVISHTGCDVIVTPPPPNMPTLPPTIEYDIQIVFETRNGYEFIPGQMSGKLKICF